MGKRLTYANVMATLAFFFALTGASMAGVKYIANGDPAGGDLTGTYPNPAIASGKVTTAKIANGAVTSSKFDGSALAPNADMLDGMDSADFAQGVTTETSDSFVSVPSTQTSLFSKSLAAGNYLAVFNGDVVFLSGGSLACVLNPGAGSGSVGGSSAGFGPMVLTSAFTIEGGVTSVEVGCHSNSGIGTTGIGHMRLQIIRVGGLSS